MFHGEVESSGDGVSAGVGCGGIVPRSVIPAGVMPRTVIPRIVIPQIVVPQVVNPKIVIPQIVIPRIMAMAEREESWWERRRRNPKRMGEVSQAAFLLKARTLGFGVALPWGDSEKYDFIVWAGEGGRMLRVQVKCTGRLDRGGYDVQPVYSTRGEGKKRYTAQDIDVLAAHILTKDVWYLLPIGAFAGAKSLRFYPDMKSRWPRWEGYREAWKWLRR